MIEERRVRCGIYESLGAIGRQSEFTGMRIGDGKYPSSGQVTDMCAKTTTTNVRYIQHALRGGIKPLEISRRVTSAKPGSKDRGGPVRVTLGATALAVSRGQFKAVI